MEWLSVTQLSKTLEIPETTTRRYLNTFDEYFRWEQIGRGKKYDPSSVEILQRIAMLYSADRETFEIKKILADEYAFTIDEENNDAATNDPPAYDISGKLDEFQKKQAEFNKQLLQQLHEQQKYINELIKNQQTDINQQKQLASPEERRTERFNQIMAERKVRRKLEEEALESWANEPYEARMKKVGLFRHEEDRNKRDEFVKKYIDKRFESYLKEEFDI